MYRVLCGVPEGDCHGSMAGASFAIGGFQVKARKMHSSHDEAFNCYIAWKQRLGYKRIGPREMEPKDGGPILVLTKRSRFGARLRLGKGGANVSSRFMPRRGGGVIV